MERLESQTFFSGVVSITTTGAYIDIVGDSQNNAISITGNYNSGTDSFFGSYFLGAAAGTSMVVDGANVGDSYFSPDKDSADAWHLKPWRIRLGVGRDADHLFVTNAYFPSLRIDMGGGSDRVELRLFGRNDFGLAGDNDATRGVSIDTGDGIDRVYLTYGARKAAYGNVSIFPGAGSDRVTIADLPENQPERIGIAGKLEIHDTQGDLNLTMRKADVTKGTSIITRNSIDKVNFSECSFRGRVAIATAGGDDILISTNCNYRSGGVVLAGAGDNTVTGFDDLLG